MRPATATLDLAALRHNLARVRAAAPLSKVFAVVKADAYGHGLARVLPALAGADALAVACVEEALIIREAKIDKPVLLLEGFFDAEDIAACAEHDLWAVIHHPSQVDLLARHPPAKPIRVWLKIDSGMNRLGLAGDKIAVCRRQLADNNAVRKDIGLLTHFARADDTADPTTGEQLTRWQALTENLDGERSSANSAAVLGWPESHLDWVRPGIMLYGISPFVEGCGRDAGLKPVMTFKTRLIAVKNVQSGDCVGYGGAWRARSATRIGIAAAGYGDGYPRHAPSGTPVLIDGMKAALAGRVSMDMLAVDLSGHLNAAVGSEVTLWGDGLPVETVAAYAGTIAYELLCGVTQRVHFRVFD